MLVCPAPLNQPFTFSSFWGTQLLAALALPTGEGGEAVRYMQGAFRDVTTEGGGRLWSVSTQRVWVCRSLWVPHGGLRTGGVRVERRRGRQGDDRVAGKRERAGTGRTWGRGGGGGGQEGDKVDSVRFIRLASSGPVSNSNIIRDR